MRLTFQDILNNMFDEFDIIKQFAADTDDAGKQLSTTIKKALFDADYSDLQFIAAEAGWDDTIGLPENQLRDEIIDGIFGMVFEPFPDKDTAEDKKIGEV